MASPSGSPKNEKNEKLNAWWVLLLVFVLIFMIVLGVAFFKTTGNKGLPPRINNIRR